MTPHSQIAQAIWHRLGPFSGRRESHRLPKGRGQIWRLRDPEQLGTGTRPLARKGRSLGLRAAAHGAGGQGAGSGKPTRPSLPWSPAEPRVPLLTRRLADTAPVRAPGPPSSRRPKTSLPAPRSKGHHVLRPAPSTHRRDCGWEAPARTPAALVPQPCIIRSVRTPASRPRERTLPLPPRPRPGPSSARAYRCRLAPWPRSECR
ncbi:WAS/WASL-interacting protein family member 1-like [Theropithecus gelada]|uniref:WAS/WASL-interacting protein family member 1-like n=1 Tax=Theropithecus gelada TaxID=9565 RepID=UPI000DC16472|nr:WAS/WASL-interacting protein family member 1-like [Theropithecus gelada]